MSRQIPLDLQLPRYQTFSSYVAGENQGVVSLLQGAVEQQQSQALFLGGNKGVGKSHLLIATCHHVLEQGLTAAYIPLKDHQKLKPEMLQGMGELGIVCIDDVDHIGALDQWQLALFHLYNEVIENQGQIIFSSRLGLKQLDIALPDLHSRISGAIVVRLQEINDEEKVAGLVIHARQLGMVLAEDVARYLLSRYQRDLGRLILLLDQLDKKVLSEKRRLTIPLLKSMVAADSNLRALLN